MKGYDPIRMDAAAHRFHLVQKRMAMITAALILISCSIGLLCGEMWLPLGMAEHLGPGITRLLSAGILGISIFAWIRTRKRSAAERGRAKKARDREYDV